jgi:hypothetical protein
VFGVVVSEPSAAPGATGPVSWPASEDAGGEALGCAAPREGRAMSVAALLVFDVIVIAAVGWLASRNNPTW